MANVNLLSQLAGSVAPQGQPFNAANVMAAGQELAYGQDRLELLRQKMQAERDEGMMRQRAQEIIASAMQGDMSLDEAGRMMMPFDAASGRQFMEWGREDEAAAEESQTLAQAMAALEQYAADNGVDPSILAADPGNAVKTIQGNLLNPPEDDAVNWTFTPGANGNIMAIHPRTLEVRDTGMKAQDSSFGGSITMPDGTFVTMGRGGYTATNDGIPVDPKVGREIQEEDLKNNKMLADLFRLGQDFMGGLVGGQTYLGKGINWMLEKADKAGIGNPASDWGEDRLKRATRFKQGIEQIFNAYRKEITGAAAAVQELERLKQAMLNADLSPTQFEAAYNEFIAKIMRGQKIAAQMAREGYDPSKDENAEMFDRMWDAGVFGDAEQINYLGLMQNIDAGNTNEVPGKGVFASDGERWVQIRGPE